MERYKNENVNYGSRMQKNTELYNEINKADISRVKANSNYRIIESDEKQINIEKIKQYVANLNEKDEKKRLKFDSFEEKNDNYQFVTDDKEYDLNKVLIEAKEKRNVDFDSNKYKKLRQDGIEILKTIESYDEKFQNDDMDFNTGEQTLIDLINTIHSNKTSIDLLKDLRGDDNTIVTKPINKEREKATIDHKSISESDTLKFERRPDETDVDKENGEIEKTKELVELKMLQTEITSGKVKQDDVQNKSQNKSQNNTNTFSKIDKSFYTNSMSFSKDDFEGFDELEKTVKKNNSLTTVGLIVLFISVAVTLIVIANYVFELGLF